MPLRNLRIKPMVFNTMRTVAPLHIFRVAVVCLAIGCAAIAPMYFTGCSTPPNARVVQVQSLKAVGQSAEAAVALCAQLYRDKQITAAQATRVIMFYDATFQPAFRLAAQAVQSNLDSTASPEIASLAAQLTEMVLKLQRNP